MARFILSEQALADVDMAQAHICADNPVAADQVQEAIFAGFELLARNPALGRRRHFRGHRNLRSWAVTAFTNYLIFCREIPDGSGIEVLRVLHGASDLGVLVETGSP